MKKILFCFLLSGMFTGVVSAQLNDYKYIIVPKKFDGFKKNNQYQTSTLLKHLFVEEGFNAVYEDALPEDLNQNRCLGLTASLEEDSSLFSTKASIVLKDCKSQEVFKTQQGSSREKEFKAAYGEALRSAFKSFENTGYAYTAEKTSSEPVTVSFKNDVKELNNPESGKEAQKEASKSDETVSQEATPRQQSYKNLEPKPSEIKKAAPPTDEPDTKAAETTQIWYAQVIPNGYQLVDNSPKVRLKLYKTSMPGVYMAEKETGSGLVYQKEGKWYLEYYDEDNLIKEELNIKF
jgi:hypothetical protein